MGVFLQAASWVVGLLTGSGGALEKLATIYTKGKDSQVESERIQADLAKAKMDNIIAGQKLANEVRLATSAYPEQRVLHFMAGAPFIIHSCAVGLDTTFKLGWKIPAYPAPFDEWQGAIIASYFGYALANKGLSIAAAVLMRRRQ